MNNVWGDRVINSDLPSFSLEKPNPVSRIIEGLPTTHPPQVSLRVAEITPELVLEPVPGEDTEAAYFD